jgi:hypothetical protein
VSFDNPWDPKILPNIPDEAIDDEEDEYEEEDDGEEEPEFGFI